MALRMGRWWALPVLAMALAFPASAGAGWLFGSSHKEKPDCPKPSYSKLHYWAPTAYRAGYHFHGTRLSPYAPDRFPDVPPSYRIIQYPCPAVDPATHYQERAILR
jgi:hypothetical protein